MIEVFKMEVRYILGLGMASMLAACYYKDAEILATTEEVQNFHSDSFHTAVLRFKTNLISKITNINIPYKTVYKEILDYNGHPIPLSIAAINAYSFKTTNCYTERSISKDEHIVMRYVPKADFISELFHKVCYRITMIDSYHDIPKIKNDEAIISTIPLWNWYDNIWKGNENNILPIRVITFKIPNCDVHQTIYLPFHVGIYRCTIEYDTLIIELIGNKSGLNMSVDTALNTTCRCFGIYSWKDFELINDKVYNFGKMCTLDIDNNKRKSAILNLTIDRHIYSLGRYATMRNIGLDAIADDIIKIDEQLNIDGYSSKLLAVK